ncbi:MAG: protein kinase [Kofleriaceae bacterium]
MFVCPDCGHSQSVAGACPADQTTLINRGDDQLVGTAVGVYRIAKLLGVGGMGRVYKGVHPQIGSRVAVKVLSRECSDRPDLVERFFSEARAVNLIRHESIVNVLDLAQLPDGRPYIIMEYLDGAPLSDLIEKLGPLPLGGMARLVGESLDALGAAHAKGIVHRDLKPDNIYVTPAGRPKVLDFGIAKLRPDLGGSATQTGSLLGTPHYMSPEQALGHPVDLRTDIYAMGVILFECATGRKPFSGDSLFDLLRKHIDEPPPPPHLLRPDMPPAMEQVILRALAKDPAHRFGSMAELAHALMQSTQGLPPDAWTTVSAASLTRHAAGAQGWSPTPASWPGGGTPMPLPGPATAPGGPPQMHGSTPMPHYQGAPGSYPPPPSASVASAAGQVMPPAVRRSSKGALVALVGVALVGGGAAAALVLGGGGGTASTPGGGSATDPATPTTIAAKDPTPVPTAPTPPIPTTPDLAQAMDQLDQASQQLQQLGQGLVEADDGAGGPSGVRPTVKVPAGKAPTGNVGTAPTGVAPPLPTGSAPAGTPPPAGTSALAKKVAAFSSGEAACDDFVRVMYAMSECDRLAASAEQMRTGVNGMMQAYGRLSAMDPDLRATTVEACASSATQMRSTLKQFACAYPPAPRLAVAAGAPPPPDPDPPLPVDRPHNIRIPGFNPASFDYMGYLPAALAEARKILPDAQLARLDAGGVGPDGRAHLKVSDDFKVLYRFVSPSAAKAPPDHPKGVKWEPLCMVQIYVEADQVMVIPMKGFGCDKVIPQPRCTAKEIWAKAIAKGAPDANAYASLWYGYAGGKWSFSIDGDFSDTFVDGC